MLYFCACCMHTHTHMYAIYAIYAMYAMYATGGNTVINRIQRVCHDLILKLNIICAYTTVKRRHIMSTRAGGYTVSDDVELSVVYLNGEECKLSISSSTLGREVQQIVSRQLPSRKGRKTTMQHGKSRLILGQTLQEQGVVGEAATLSCTFVPTDVYSAWRYIQGLPVPEGELSLEGVTRIAGISSRELLQLP